MAVSKPLYDLKSENSKEYKDSINILNNLTSNAKSIRESINSSLDLRGYKRDKILKFLSDIGIQEEDLNKLSIIHVAGTKGKGTTCALCESILRAHGYKTGFYSSPHMISVTERIKINGLSIEKDYFSNIFFKIYNQLIAKKENKDDMPAYFGFLTIMAFYIFIKNNVDVAIIEVGIGGEYDQTNIMKKVPVVGITTLGLDHTEILGETIEEIASQKAGIMKFGSKVFTSPQEQKAMNVLHDVAKIKQCSLEVVPSFESYKLADNVLLKNQNPTKHINASLAIQLSYSWMLQNKNKDNTENNIKIEENDLVNISKITLDSIVSTKWPGRCQIIRNDSEDIFIDGAHNYESMQLCFKWFKNKCSDSSPKILIFYMTKNRKPGPLMEILSDIKFDMALFVPDNTYDDDIIIDQADPRHPISQKLEKCNENALLWKEIHNNVNEQQHQEIKVLSSISAALNYIHKYFENQQEKPQILVTGSLLLAAAALTILDPSLSRFDD